MATTLIIFENQLTKLTHLVQFKRVFVYCLRDYGVGEGLGKLPPWLHHCLRANLQSHKRSL